MAGGLKSSSLWLYIHPITMNVTPQECFWEILQMHSKYSLGPMEELIRFGLSEVKNETQCDTLRGKKNPCTTKYHTNCADYIDHLHCRFVCVQKALFQNLFCVLMLRWLSLQDLYQSLLLVMKPFRNIPFIFSQELFLINVKYSLAPLAV